MNTNKSVIIECSRENSIDVKANGLSGGNNATWENLTDLQLNEGDQVSVSFSTIHAIGADSESTIELNGEADPITEITDNQVLFQFSPYICNTGHNFVVCPYVLGITPATEYDPFYDDGVNPIRRGLQYYKIMGQKTFRNAPASEGGTASGKKNTALYGMPISVEDGSGRNTGYRFDVKNNTADYPQEFANSPYFYKTSNLLENCDGSRFQKINVKYQSPFKKEDGTFFSNDEDGTGFEFEKYEIPITIEAPKFESPSVICNKINQIFHRTAPQKDEDFTAEAKALEEHDLDLDMLKLTGGMFRAYACNGEIPNNDKYRGANRFWSAMCVKDFNKWYMVHYGMRLTINISDFTPPSTGTNYPVFYPCFYSGRYKQLKHDGSGFHNFYRFPTKRFQQHTGGSFPYRYYSTLPQYFLVSTNIDWTQENVDSLIDIIKKNEKYDGDHDNIDDANNDVSEWFFTSDIGRCDETPNTHDDGNTASRNGGIENYYDGWNGGTAAQVEKFNILANWVEYDELSDTARKPLKPYYMGDGSENDFENEKYFPVPCRNYTKKNGVNDSAGEVGGKMDRSGSITFYSRYLDDWQTKATIRNYPVQPGGDFGVFFGDGRPTNDATNPKGNEIYINGFEDTGIDVKNYGLYPVKVFDDDGNEHTSISFMVFNPTAYRGDDKWYLDDSTARANGYEGRTIRPCWCIPNLSYALGSPSSSDNPYGLIINGTVSNNYNRGFSNGISTNDSRNTEYAGMPNTINGFQNFVMLGASDATMTFDSTLSRTAIQNLHTPRFLGAEEQIFKSGSTTEVIGANVGEKCCVFNDRLYPGGFFNQLKYTGSKNGSPDDPRLENDSEAFATISDALSGVYLENIFFQRKGQTIQSSTNNDAIEASKNNFNSSLLFKLGMRKEDLFPSFGNSNQRYNMGYQKDYSKENRYFSVKPITTNEDLTISSALSLDLVDGVRDAQATGSGQPSFKLGLGSFNRFNIQAPGSVSVLASRLPTRLDNSFYLIYSDIVNSEYIREEQKLTCVGLSSKGYSSGDFFLSFGDNSFGSITNTKPHMIKSIKTEIRTPNGQLAPISEKSSVIYKVVKPAEQPTLQTILKEIQKPKPRKKSTSNNQVLEAIKEMSKNQEDMIDILMETLNIKLDKKKKK